LTFEYLLPFRGYSKLITYFDTADK